MSDIVMDDGGYTFEELEQRYAGFLTPAFQIMVNGKDIVRESGVAVTRVTVQTTVEPKADSFTFVVANAFDLETREFKWLDEYFSLGNYVEIRLGYLDRLETVFYGIITAVRFDYPAGGAMRLIIMGMDISFLMMKGIHSASWKNKKHSEVVREIGSRYVDKFVIDDTNEVIGTVVQNALEDFHFITGLAEENNFDFFIVGRTLYFRKPLKDKKPVITLSLGTSLRSFSSELNLANQVSQVIVRGWVEKDFKVVEAKSREVNVLGTNSKTGKDIMKVLGDFTKEYMYTNVDSMAEAEKKADAALNKRSMELITGEGETIGLPQLRAGKYIQLENLGEKFNQPLYLKAVTHTLDSGGYLVTFNVGGNAI